MSVNPLLEQNPQKSVENGVTKSIAIASGIRENVMIFAICFIIFPPQSPIYLSVDKYKLATPTQNHSSCISIIISLYLLYKRFLLIYYHTASLDYFILFFHFIVCYIYITYIRVYLISYNSYQHVLEFLKILTHTINECSQVLTSLYNIGFQDAFLIFTRISMLSLQLYSMKFLITQ